jgi:hypothetical protein
LEAYAAAQVTRTELTDCDDPRSTSHHCPFVAVEDQRVVEELLTALPAS